MRRRPVFPARSAPRVVRRPRTDVRLVGAAAALWALLRLFPKAQERQDRHERGQEPGDGCDATGRKDTPLSAVPRASAGVPTLVASPAGAGGGAVIEQRHRLVAARFGFEDVPALGHYPLERRNRKPAPFSPGGRAVRWPVRLRGVLGRPRACGSFRTLKPCVRRSGGNVPRHRRHRGAGQVGLLPPSSAPSRVATDDGGEQAQHGQFTAGPTHLNRRGLSAVGATSSISEIPPAVVITMTRTRVDVPPASGRRKKSDTNSGPAKAA